MPEMELALWLGGLGGLAYWVYSTYNLESGAWKRRRRALVDHAVAQGLTPLSAESSVLTGSLGGLPFRIGVSKHRGPKSQCYRLSGELAVPNWSGVTVLPEGLLTGAQRLTGNKEVVLKDCEVDACFWLEGQEDTLRRLFTPPLRQAFLRSLSELPNGELRQGTITAELVLLTPFFLNRHFLTMLERFQWLAAAYQGQDCVGPLPDGFVVGRRLRRFALTSLGFLGPLGLLSLALPLTIGMVAQLILAIGLGLTLLALTGRQMARLLLQAYYAFLTIVFALLALGAANAFFQGQMELKNLGAALLSCLVLMGLCWSARHYMKALDLTGVTAAKENPRTPNF
jgi:hypothetical protein